MILTSLQQYLEGGVGFYIIEMKELKFKGVMSIIQGQRISQIEKLRTLGMKLGFV